MRLFYTTPIFWKCRLLQAEEYAGCFTSRSYFSQPLGLLIFSAQSLPLSLWPSSRRAALSLPPHAMAHEPYMHRVMHAFSLRGLRAAREKAQHVYSIRGTSAQPSPFRQHFHFLSLYGILARGTEHRQINHHHQRGTEMQDRVQVLVFSFFSPWGMPRHEAFSWQYYVL